MVKVNIFEQLWFVLYLVKFFIVGDYKVGLFCFIINKNQISCELKIWRKLLFIENIIK